MTASYTPIPANAKPKTGDRDMETEIIISAAFLCPVSWGARDLPAEVLSSSFYPSGPESKCRQIANDQGKGRDTTPKKYGYTGRKVQYEIDGKR